MKNNLSDKEQFFLYVLGFVFITPYFICNLLEIPTSYTDDLKLIAILGLPIAISFFINIYQKILIKSKNGNLSDREQLYLYILGLTLFMPYLVFNLFKITTLHMDIFRGAAILGLPIVVLFLVNSYAPQSPTKQIVVHEVKK